MKVVDVVPGTTQWAEARLGIPTASCFDKIITPAKLEFSKQAEGYALQLLAEQILRSPMDDATSGFMSRGTDMESDAIRWYEFRNDDIETVPVGFILRDDGRTGCTPDSFVGNDGLLEIKCPKADTHLGYLLDEKGIGYRLQVQGQLWIAEREWNDTLSYNPQMPKSLVRQHRDETVIKAIASALDRFHEMLADLKEKLQKHGLFEDFKRAELKVMAGGAA